MSSPESRVDSWCHRWRSRETCERLNALNSVPCLLKERGGRSICIEYTALKGVNYQNFKSDEAHIAYSSVAILYTCDHFSCLFADFAHALCFTGSINSFLLPALRQLSNKLKKSQSTPKVHGCLNIDDTLWRWHQKLWDDCCSYVPGQQRETCNKMTMVIWFGLQWCLLNSNHCDENYSPASVKSGKGWIKCVYVKPLEDLIFPHIKSCLSNSVALLLMPSF